MAWFEHGTSRIYFEDVGSGTPILLMPGLTGSIKEFTALCDRLGGEGYRVIAADLPGSGRSEPQPRMYTADYYAEDAGAFTALLGHVGVEKTHLVGFSDGGEVSLLMAALTPAIARSVVAWGAVGVISDPDEQLVRLMYNVVDHPIPPMQEYRDYLVTVYGEENARATTQNFANAAREIVRRGGDISLSRVGDITCDVLLMNGENDFLAPAPLAAQLAEKIRSVRIEVVPNAGHDVYRDQTEWFTEMLTEWLKRH